MTMPIHDPEVEGFLALLAASRAPRTVEAYSRDLAALGAYLGKPVTKASLEELERYTATLRADGLAATTIARRTAAARSFFRHQQLLGAREDNPAAAVKLPRRAKPLPKTLSPGEAERLIDAAKGTQPRSLRDQALVELLYGAGLRVSEAVGLTRTGVDLDDRFVRVTGKGGKERVVPIGRHAAEAVRRYVSRGRPYLDRRHRPELFLNAKGGPLTRAGAFPSFAVSPRRPGSTPLVSTRTSSGTRSPLTCSREAQTSDQFRKCSVTPIYPRQSSTPTYPTRAGASCTTGHIHMPAEAVVRSEVPIDPHTELFLALAAAWLMTKGRAGEEHARAQAAPRDLPVLRTAAAL